MGNGFTEKTPYFAYLTGLLHMGGCFFYFIKVKRFLKLFFFQEIITRILGVNTYCIFI